MSVGQLLMLIHGKILKKIRIYICIAVLTFEKLKIHVFGLLLHDYAQNIVKLTF